MNTKKAIELGQLNMAHRNAQRCQTASTRLHQRGVMLFNAWIMWALMAFLLATTCKSADFVIVVDVSGSMSEAISHHDKRVRITVVQDALRQYLPALPLGTRVDLIAFNSGIVSEQEVVLKTDQDVACALSWGDGLSKRVGNNTHLWTTLRHALEKAARYSKENTEQPVTVRVLTDGEDNERATTLDKVLQEFQPLLDGEKIAGNLVLLGDLELKTKLSLPEGAFEVTTNPTWEVLFPPIVMLAPVEPKIGETVRLFENNTRSIYKDYEWRVDGTVVGKEKVLSWRFTEPRSYRVTLKVTGLQGTKNSATVLVRAKERDKLMVDFVASTTQPEPRQEVRFLGRCSGQGTKSAWFVNSNQVATTQDLSFRFNAEGKYEVKLMASDVFGTAGVRVQTILVKEQSLTASIKGPAEIVSGRAAQFASEIAGPCASVEWRFGDGATSTERNPQHTYECGDSEFKDHAVSLRVFSPLGKAVEATPHTVRVWAEKKAPAPQAMFRILTQNPRAGDPLQLVDETTGLVEVVQWTVDGEAKGSTRNPEFCISTPGEKTIRMTVRGPGGESVATKTITVRPRYSQPVVWCGASKLTGTAPLTVQFTNRVTGDYKSLQWTFGDGQTSSNSSPRHTFVTATNYVAVLTVAPLDGTQQDTKQSIVINVVKPWALWAKVTAVAVPCIILLACAAGLIRQRRRNALRLPVYYWAEEDLTCRTRTMTEAGEVVDLLPAAPIRIRRDGASRNLVIDPVAGATLFTAGEQEASMISVGDGVRVTVRDVNGLSRAVAIALDKKPSRPLPATGVRSQSPEVGLCGLHNTSEAEVPPHSSDDEFDWGWGKTAAAKNG